MINTDSLLHLTVSTRNTLWISINRCHTVFSTEPQWNRTQDRTIGQYILYISAKCLRRKPKVTQLPNTTVSALTDMLTMTQTLRTNQCHPLVSAVTPSDLHLPVLSWMVIRLRSEGKGHIVSESLSPIHHGWVSLDWAVWTTVAQTKGTNTIIGSRAMHVGPHVCPSVLILLGIYITWLSFPSPLTLFLSLHLFPLGLPNNDQ